MARSVADLLGLLGCPSAKDRCEAATALGSLGAAAATGVTALRAALHDAGVHTTEFGHISQSPPPDYYSYDHHHVRDAALRALAEIAPAEAADEVAPVLVELLGHKSREVDGGEPTYYADEYPRHYAALIRRFGEPVRAALIAAADHPDANVRRGATALLERWAEPGAADVTIDVKGRQG
jgi:hypothetical protein